MADRVGGNAPTHLTSAAMPSMGKVPYKHRVVEGKLSGSYIRLQANNCFHASFFDKPFHVLRIPWARPNDDTFVNVVPIEGPLPLARGRGIPTLRRSARSCIVQKHLLLLLTSLSRWNEVG